MGERRRVLRGSFAFNSLCEIPERWRLLQSVIEEKRSILFVRFESNVFYVVDILERYVQFSL